MIDTLTIKSNTILGHAILFGLKQNEEATIAMVRDQLKDSFCGVVEVMGMENIRRIDPKLCDEINNFVNKKYKKKK